MTYTITDAQEPKHSYQDSLEGIRTTLFIIWEDAEDNDPVFNTIETGGIVELSELMLGIDLLVEAK